MGDDCSFEAQSKADRSVSASLQLLRDRHQAVARYRVVESTRSVNDVLLSESRITVIETGLTWDDATELSERLNNERTNKSFGGPLFLRELENEEEVARKLGYTWYFERKKPCPPHS